MHIYYIYTYTYTHIYYINAYIICVCVFIYVFAYLFNNIFFFVYMHICLISFNFVFEIEEIQDYWTPSTVGAGPAGCCRSCLVCVWSCLGWWWRQPVLAATAGCMAIGIYNTYILKLDEGNCSLLNF